MGIRAKRLRPYPAVKERILNAAWGLGLRTRNVAKRLGVLGPMEPILLKLAPLLVRPPSGQTEVTLTSGMRMVVPPGFPSARSYASGLYEEDVTHLIRGIVQEGMSVVDVGANVGYYTLLASSLVGETGRVYAFEPDPTVYSCLISNVEASACHNVRAVVRAVSNECGSASFITDQRGAQGRLSATVSDTGAIDVQTITLDRFFSDLGWPTVDLMKIDVEGAEGSVLGGMRELTERNPDLKLIMEYDLAHLARAGTTREGIATTLAELGFRHGRIIERSKEFTLPDGLPAVRGTYNLLLVKR